MKLAISNLAWNENPDFYYQLMKKYGFTALEIAPSKWSEDPYDHLDLAKDLAKKLKNDHQIEIVSMQALLFGTEDLLLFEDESKREKLKNYLKKAIIYAQNIGCPVLVFGNPKNRITQNTAKDYPIAVSFFKELGDFAQKHATCLCIEPNPVDYGTNFINTLKQANDLVNEVKTEGFKMIIDTSTMWLNGDSPEISPDFIKNTKHIHISRPFLKSLSLMGLEDEKWLKKFIFALKENGYNEYISIEMLNANPQAIEQSLQIIQKITTN